MPRMGGLDQAVLGVGWESECWKSWVGRTWKWLGQEEASADPWPLHNWVVTGGWGRARERHSGAI